MTPKERRERLFKGLTPKIRLMEEDDLKWLYGAYKYPKPIGDEEDRAQWLEKIQVTLAGYDEAFIIEDRNTQFQNNWGAVAVFPSMYNNWKLQPSANWFPWATKLNKIRCTIAFLMFARHNRDIGVTVINAVNDDKDFYRGLKRYAPIYPVGKIPCGDPRGDENLFYIRGKKKLTTTIRA